MNKPRMVAAGMLVVVLAGAALAARPVFDGRALASAGYRDSHGSPTEFFAARAKRGQSPAQVSQSMPRPKAIERFIAPTSNGDSLLLERYVYKRGIGRWDVYVYYARSKGVVDVYAQDVPTVNGARPITPEEAALWYARTGLSGPPGR